MIGLVALCATGFAGVAAAAPAPSPPDVLRNNLIWNGSFDVANSAGHPLGWAVEGNESGVNVVNRSAYRGTGLTSLQIVDDSASSGMTVTSKRAVAVPGTRYTLNWFQKSEKGKAGTSPSVHLQFFAMSPPSPQTQGPMIGDQTLQPTASEDGQELEISAIAPEGTVQVRVQIVSDDPTIGNTHFDNFRLKEEGIAYDPKVDSDRELFLDDYRIESRTDIGRVIHPAKKSPTPLIQADKPWEKTVYTYGSVMQPEDSKTYRMYYTCFTPDNRYGLCLAESRDLKKWTKPNLGLIEYDGSTANNLVGINKGNHVAYNPDAPADRRYAMLAFNQGPAFGYYLLTSSDGLRFTLADSKPVLPGGDVVALTYNAEDDLYVATYKDRLFQSDTPGTYDRSAFISTSKDLKTWTAETLAVSGEVADDATAYELGGVETQIYGMPAIKYESQYIGIPWDVQLTGYDYGEYAQAGDGPVVPGIASTRDLLHWDRMARGPIIEPSDPGAWDDGAHYTATTLNVTKDTVELFYGGFNTGHGGSSIPGYQKASVGLATWRRDGWVSMTNAARDGLGNPGTIVTKPLAFGGDSLYVNVNTKRYGGQVTVDVLDAGTGEPIPALSGNKAIPVRGDHTAVQVKWRGSSLKNVQGQQIKLRFNVTGADLYSFWFQD
ncbi:hypothetical protein [Nakamurella aerolata]|uniref:Uncharacterized protein n=1 Tax=Nakamurella aerolata TaxID=1656892 RepID=A0A849A6N9_9ACTN|nr:hypothetical protein [Nakamurella aerolata]NNG35113.1 hypothetical protein [Nakamurella aerolata]